MASASLSQESLLGPSALPNDQSLVDAFWLCAECVSIETPSSESRGVSDRIKFCAKCMAPRLAEQSPVEGPRKRQRESPDGTVERSSRREFMESTILRIQPEGWKCAKCRVTAHEDVESSRTDMLLEGIEGQMRHHVCTACGTWKVLGLPTKGVCIDCVDDPERWVRQMESPDDSYVKGYCRRCLQLKIIAVPEESSGTEASETVDAAEIGCDSESSRSAVSSSTISNDCDSPDGKKSTSSVDSRLPCREKSTPWELLGVVTELGLARQAGEELRQRNESLPASQRKTFIHFVEECRCKECNRRYVRSVNGDYPDRVTRSMPPIYWHETHSCLCKRCERIHFVLTPIHVRHCSSMRPERTGSVHFEHGTVSVACPYRLHRFATCECEVCMSGRQREERWGNEMAYLGLPSTEELNMNGEVWALNLQR